MSVRIFIRMPKIAFSYIKADTVCGSAPNNGKVTISGNYTVWKLLSRNERCLLINIKNMFHKHLSLRQSYFMRRHILFQLRN